LRAQDIERVDR